MTVTEIEIKPKKRRAKAKTSVLSSDCYQYLSCNYEEGQIAPISVHERDELLLARAKELAEIFNAQPAIPFDPRVLLHMSGWYDLRVDDVSVYAGKAQQCIRKGSGSPYSGIKKRETDHLTTITRLFKEGKKLRYLPEFFSRLTCKIRYTVQDNKKFLSAVEEAIIESRATVPALQYSSFGNIGAGYKKRKEQPMHWPEFRDKLGLKY